jgi:predicted small secreted protein
MRLALIAFCLVSILSLSACNTLNGIGKDFETAGQTLQDL